MLNFYRISYGTRIWLSFVLIITISILATGWASYHIAANTLQQNAIQMSQDTVNKSAQIFDEKLQKIALSIMSLMISDSFQDAMRDSTLGTRARYYEHFSNLQYVFSQLSFNEPIIQGILIATPIGDFYPTSNIRARDQSFYDSPIYEQMKKHRAPMWLEGHEDTFFSGNERVLSLVMEGVMSYPLNDVYILVNIKEKELVATLSRDLSLSPGPIYLLNSAGEPVLRSSDYLEPKWDVDLTDLREALYKVDPDNALSNGSFELYQGNSEYLVNFYRSRLVSDWTVFRVQSKAEILSQASAIRWTTMMIIGICVIIALIISNLLSRWLILPLRKLGRLMSRVETEDDLRFRYHSRYDDEISQVGNAFNHMVDRIEKLIEEVRMTEHSKRLAEMKALTAQIDPHFFYNALHTVYCKSVLGENDKVNEMIIALSEMFRLGLNNGQDMTTLKAELEHVSKYLIIQQNCYEELFAYRIRFDDAIPMNYPVLRLILQPLVENSILHGFSQQSSGGIIDIQVKLEDGHLILSVTDNGIGFDEAEMDHSSGYALQNIRERLALYYEGNAKLSIHSVRNEGTRVEITLPYAEGMSIDE